MKKKRILFTGGGTAGHVIVNLALIPVYQNNGWEIDYIGSHNGIERDLIGQLDGVTYHPISTGKLRRYMSKENLKDPFKVMKGTMQAFWIIGKRKPSIIFSKGGFVSVPVVMAAKLRGVPVVIHESDYTPGLANKLSIPFAKKVLATFPETMNFLPEKKAEYVGAVIRDELFQGKREKGLAISGLTRERPVLLIMGGSGGSHKINETVRSSLPELLSFFQVIHICGKEKVDSSINEKGYVQFEYVNEELKDIFAATDYVLSRAGSNAIFEFLALRIPMLLIPLSKEASRGDQIINANSFVEKSYARVLEEESLTNESLIHELTQLKDYASIMIDHMKKYKSEKARDRVIEILEEVGK
ncbi:undecaprenyldiphospho-muramoylpentapeptide beta-N-acetylglucosaminyltransferase [Oceanobacillus zhaokaii]|uniref:UDP-N-acetylglucosamine--N-acetylmuramyl-(pentapeptide) pyrophosphoryl-undecaprenol N-acetylglucosamine transferase n=1 Tax=Oceanobacillus zhaokaii TaxID=2052660 RepID=A0A345PF82_9BACI|nr:undecaprenyldiphospho-muramoylpentapeptide beta-N-acetylglucosaminyltransferase [Oceanobacillus zhaokaii]AXI08662.1 undecaprenyldiphospho-muramoylpentapeptide beta-N-acetylglucosaminyltransferase [Oceanobacillus zhaokaii]